MSTTARYYPFIYASSSGMLSFGSRVMAICDFAVTGRRVRTMICWRIVCHPFEGLAILACSISYNTSGHLFRAMANNLEWAVLAPRWKASLDLLYYWLAGHIINRMFPTVDISPNMMNSGESQLLAFKNLARYISQSQNSSVSVSTIRCKYGIRLSSKSKEELIAEYPAVPLKHLEQLLGP